MKLVYMRNTEQVKRYINAEQIVDIVLTKIDAEQYSITILLTTKDVINERLTANEVSKLMTALGV